MTDDVKDAMDDNDALATYIRRVIHPDVDVRQHMTPPEKHRHVLAAEVRRLEAENARLKAALEELAAMVRGECPSLLNEDSGGDAKLSIEIDELLSAKEGVK